MMDFTKYRTANELFEETGLTVKEALENINQQISELKN